ncbi:Pr6Pr family membrane protein [Actinomadura parmotrematis]|uniref:Pr6Pr family membrane protein n=1 Tax=Actinomadura parmotrematis TaxID=2864039 RepID=A0ABS7FKT9_9ACTN|nr:Pr6Pr family membrane protein [Actinomadura parmotrematis]MBW8480971.1 Pr6Pr family membrane protein [Actinomadura parmotrematis]
MRGLVTAWRAGCGLLALGTVAVAYAFRRPGLDAVDFWSYWTNLSNCLGGLVLLAGALPGRRGGAALDRLRGAAALYLAITGVVYALLLGGEVANWPGWVQHRLMPVALPLDWLLFTPVRRLPPWRTLLAWLAVPLGYLGYVLAHGARTRWYPYPFLNADRYGYPAVAGYALLLAGIFTAAAAALLVWADLRRRLLRLGKRLAGVPSWVRETS